MEQKYPGKQNFNLSIWQWYYAVETFTACHQIHERYLSMIYMSKFLNEHSIAAHWHVTSIFLSWFLQVNLCHCVTDWFSIWKQVTYPYNSCCILPIFTTIYTPAVLILLHWVFILKLELDEKPVVEPCLTHSLASTTTFSNIAEF